MPSYSSRWWRIQIALFLSIVSTPRATFATDPNWDAFGGSPTAPNGTVLAVAQAGGVIYVGGSFSSPTAFIARVHDNQMIALGSGVNADVNAILLDSGELYAGGAFSMAGGVAASRVAHWNGATWLALGDGVDGVAHALESVGGRLYAGGNVSAAGGQPAAGIASWDGAQWSQVGGGVDGVVYTLCRAGDQLYVGGDFVSGSGQTLNYIARWDGAQWHPLGSGVDGSVRAIAVVDGNVFVGGNFTFAGGVSTARIARWDGVAWHALGSGASATVHALVADRHDLLVGGSFLTVDGLPAARVARWDGGAWSVLGAGLDATVRSLTVTPTGIVAVGAFNASGLVSAPKIAKFDGDLWTSPTNQAPNEIVREIVTVGTDVYVAGGFTRVAGIPANYVARWDADDESWSSVGHGLEFAPENTVHAMAYDTDRGELYCADAGPFGGLVNLVRWNGTWWQAVDYLFPAHKIHTLAYVDGALYAAGDQPSLNNIAKLVNPGVLGGQWQTLGSGLAPDGVGILEIHDIVGADGYVYVAGRFSCSVPTGTVYDLARWNGSEWSAVGDCCGTTSFGVWGLAYDGTRLYAIRTTSLGVFWNSTWSYFGGEGSYQATIEAVDGVLYKGDAGGFERWSGGHWDPIGGCGIDMPVTAIGGVGGDVLVGGTFSEAGCKISHWFARWQDTVVAIGDAPPQPSKVDVMVFPNPFNPLTTIRFDTENAGLTTVRIFDVAGRLVKTLLNRSVPAGSYTISWDGTRANGESVVSGVYFCEVRTDARRAVAKLTLLK